MRIACDSCNTEHELDPPSWVLSSGKAFRFRCSACGHSQMVDPPGGLGLSDDPRTVAATPRPSSTPAPAPAPATELYIRQDDRVYLVKDWATLQRWIVERRVARDDEYSEGGIHWHSVGGVPTLGSFFAAIDQIEAAELAGGLVSPSPPARSSASGLARLDDDTEGVPIGLPPLPTEDLDGGDPAPFPEVPPSRLTPIPAPAPRSSGTIPDFSEPANELAGTDSVLGPAPEEDVSKSADTFIRDAGDVPESDPWASTTDQDTRGSDALPDEPPAGGSEHQPDSGEGLRPPSVLDVQEDEEFPENSPFGAPFAGATPPPAPLRPRPQDSAPSFADAPSTPDDIEHDPLSVDHSPSIDESLSSLSSEIAESLGDEAVVPLVEEPHLGIADAADAANAAADAEAEGDDDGDVPPRSQSSELAKQETPAPAPPSGHDPFLDFSEDPAPPAPAVAPSRKVLPLALWVATGAVAAGVLGVVGWGFATGRFSSEPPPSVEQALTEDPRPLKIESVQRSNSEEVTSLSTDALPDQAAADAADAADAPEPTQAAPEPEPIAQAAPVPEPVAQAVPVPEPVAQAAPTPSPATNTSAPPRSPSVAQLNERGWGAIDRGQLQSALTTFQKAIEQAPTHAGAHFGAGYAQLQLGRVDEGKRSLCKALTLNPGGLKREIEAVLKDAGQTCP